MIYYIYSQEYEAFVEENKKLEVWDREVIYLPFSRWDELDTSKASHLLVTGCLEEIKRVIGMALEYTLSLGIIPHPLQKELRRTFDLPLKIENAIGQALIPHENKIDILYANDTVVLQEVVVGDAPPLDQFDTALKGKGLFERVKLFWRTVKRVKRLTHTRMKIIDGKSNEIKLSAVGVVGIAYQNATFASKLIRSQVNATDGKLSVVILSPISILQYTGYLFGSLISHWTPKRLPRSVGYICSSQITIEPSRELDVLIDSVPMQKSPVILEVKECALSLSVGEAFLERGKAKKSDKDTMKIDHLPSDEESVNYLSKAIPLFSHASQSQYTALFKNLREESILSVPFMILLLFASMIATFGLFINSGSVIIGAMLLAPLMQPIVSLSMGVLRQDRALQLNGSRTIFVGVLTVLFASTLITFFTPIEQLTTEMNGRLSPTILDLFVAVVSGGAAAYAKSNEKIAGSLAGVAIAVALVPPIAVAGIGLGWGDWHMFGLAFLLFITNLVGIVLAAALTFVVLGFSPWHIAKKGILIWLAIVVVVAVPLYSSFSTMKEDIHIQKELSNRAFTVGENHVQLRHIELFHRDNKDLIRCEVVASNLLDKAEKLRLKELIRSSVGREVEVVVSFRYRL